MIKAVIFDFFGVIVGDGFDATYRIAGGDSHKDKLFIEQLLDKANRALISPQEFQEQICTHLGISAERYIEAVNRSENINMELLGYIKSLRASYKTAILSNVNKGGLERRLNTGTLDEYFDVVVASGEVGYIKPEPQIYELTAKKLGVQVGECVFIDDREPYVIAAQEVGMSGIVYHDFEQMKTELNKILAADSDK